MSRAKTLSTLTDTLPSPKCFLTEVRCCLWQQHDQKWSPEVRHERGAPSLPGDQPGREQISCQRWANHDEGTLSQFHVAFVLDTLVGWAKERHEAETKVAPGGSCGGVTLNNMSEYK